MFQIVPYQQLACNKQFHASIPTNARRHSSCTSRYAFSKSVRPYIAPNHVLKSLDSQLYTSMMGNSKKIKSRVCVLGLFFHHLMSSKKTNGSFWNVACVWTPSLIINGKGSIVWSEISILGRTNGIKRHQKKHEVGRQPREVSLKPPYVYNTYTCIYIYTTYWSRISCLNC